MTVPNSLPRSPRVRPISSVELGRERAAADAGRVRLGDAEHVAQRARAQAGAGGGRARDRVRRGHERVGAVVDVEHRSLRALEENALAGTAHPVQRLPDDIGEGQNPRAQPSISSSRSAPRVDLVHAKAAKQGVVVKQQRIDLGRDDVRYWPDRRGGLRGAPTLSS